MSMKRFVFIILLRSDFIICFDWGMWVLAATLIDLVMVAAYLLLEDDNWFLKISFFAFLEYMFASRLGKVEIYLSWLGCYLFAQNYILYWAIVAAVSFRIIHVINVSKLIEKSDRSMLVKVLWEEKFVGLL